MWLQFVQKSYSFREKFPLGCGKCECTVSGYIHCPCTTISIRKEIRDMTPEEMKRYQNAIKVLAMQDTWRNLTSLYREFVPQSRGNVYFLAWHRFFLRYVEMKLQEIDCSVTIPYFDWTLDVGSLETSVVWQANYFGDKIWYDWAAENPNNIQTFPTKYRYTPLLPFSITSDGVLRSDLQLCVSYKDITEGAPCIDGSKTDPTIFNSQKTLSNVVDVNGYDIDGYDAFGYDRMGTSNNVNVQPITSAWEEFNQLGYRATGFDFNGYDVYGFNANGYDRNNCSYFSKGPFYPIFMKNARKEMKSLPKAELDKIKSNCPYMSELPEWWLNLYWLNRNSTGKLLYLSPSSENTYSPFSNNKELWLAPTPEEHGQIFLSDCISVDGNVKADGEAGLVSCSSVQCDTACDHPVPVPGSCCPVCDDEERNNSGLAGSIRLGYSNFSKTYF
ncbi:hypothetical protein CEXT_250991 [Caerostris extrusa]|uniref:Tyrosinase copper-binding domain-containing protein n=1 Tax=Caerostris extrusa TaxID=172846 RepID=A0AAV4PWM4_CAEEX|nr:hypothetical protein CEXT_250991 [Caerostris extrusa]